MYNYLLNTENYEPVFRASKKITELVRENDAIIARLNNIVDLTLRLPQPCDIADSEEGGNSEASQNGSSKHILNTGIEADFASGKASHKLQSDGNFNNDVYSDKYKGNTEASKEPRSEYGKDAQEPNSNNDMTSQKFKSDYSQVSKSEDVGDLSTGVKTRTNKFGRTSSENPDVSIDEEPEDYLRNYLEQVLKVSAVPCDQFERVQNTRVRQLLKDNFRLQQIRDQKQTANRQLLEIHSKYHQLLKEVAIPRLNQDVYEHRISQCEAERSAVEKSFSQTNLIWKAYIEYLEVLEEVRGVAEKLVDLVAQDVNDAAMARLYMQLDIIARLKSQLDSLSLGRISRSP